MPPAPSSFNRAASGVSGLSIRPLRAEDLDPLVKFANTLVKEKRTNRALGVGAFDRRVTRKAESKFLRMMMAESGAKRWG